MCRRGAKCAVLFPECALVLLKRIVLGDKQKSIDGLCCEPAFVVYCFLAHVIVRLLSLLASISHREGWGMGREVVALPLRKLSSLPIC